MGLCKDPDMEVILDCPGMALGATTSVLVKGGQRRLHTGHRRRGHAPTGTEAEGMRPQAEAAEVPRASGRTPCRPSDTDFGLLASGAVRTHGCCFKAPFVVLPRSCLGKLTCPLLPCARAFQLPTQSPEEHSRCLCRPHGLELPQHCRFAPAHQTRARATERNLTFYGIIVHAQHVDPEAVINGKTGGQGKD